MAYYDLQRLSRAISKRHFPRVLPGVQNSTAETASPIPSDPNTVAVLPPAPDGTTSEAQARSSTSITRPSASGQTTRVLMTSTGDGEQSHPTGIRTQIPRSSVQSLTASIGPMRSSPAQTSESRTIQGVTAESQAAQSPATESQASRSQKSESHQSSAGNGGHQTLDKAMTTAKVPPTSTSICFDCAVMFSTATAAYLSLGTVTSTIRIQTTIDGKETTVKKAVTSLFTTKAHVKPGETNVPSTTTIQQVTTLPETIEIVQHGTTDSVGSTASQAVTSIVRGATSTMNSAVVLRPSQSWVTTIGAVSTSTLSSRTALHTTTITNRDGDTVTSTYLITLAPSTAVVTATYGTVIGPGNRPAAPTSPSSSSSDTSANSVVVVIGISRSQYLSGSFLPTLIAVLVAMALKAIDVNARLFQPFIALTARPAGTSAEESVFLRFYGWRSVVGAFPRAFRLRQPLVIVGQLLVACAALLVPLAAEAVRVYVPDDCTGECPGSLGVDIASGRALQVLMSLLIALLVGSIGLLAWVKTGVIQNPWSVAGMAALGVNQEMRDLLKGVDRGVERRIDDWELFGALARRRYALGGDGGEEARFGVRVTDFPVMPSEALLKRTKKQAEKEADMTSVAGRAPAIPFYPAGPHRPSLVVWCCACAAALLREQLG
jgi:hypothetical protein